MTNGIRVIPKDQLWLVERGNYLLGEFKTTEQALQLARKRARSSHSDVLIYDNKGDVVKRETYKSSPAA